MLFEHKETGIRVKVTIETETETFTNLKNEKVTVIKRNNLITDGGQEVSPFTIKHTVEKSEISTVKLIAANGKQHILTRIFE